MVEMELNWNWKHFTIFGKLKVKMVHLTSFWYLEKTAYICEMNIVGWIRGSYTDTTLRYTLNTVTERQLNIFWAKKTQTNGVCEDIQETKKWRQDIEIERYTKTLKFLLQEFNTLRYSPQLCAMSSIFFFYLRHSN